MTKEPEPSGKQLLQNIKAKAKQTKKEQRNTNMKNFINRIKTPLTVLVTLAIVAALYAFHVWSYEQGVDHQRSIVSEVNKQVAELKTSE